MEPIPEEDHEIMAFSPTHTIKHEKKSRLTEVFTSEQVDTIVSKVPKSAVPPNWDSVNEEEITQPRTSTYVTDLTTPTSAKGSTYSYTYESHYDEPSDEVSDDSHYSTSNCDSERHSSQTQKITRFTKVTTTRSVRQLPYTDTETEYFFDADGNPLPITPMSPTLYENVPYSSEELLTLGIDLSSDVGSVDRYKVMPGTPPPAPNSLQEAQSYKISDTPSAPGVAQITDVTEYDLEISWLRPESDGSAGPIVGYEVELKEIGTTEWFLAIDDLIKETHCRIFNLNPKVEYEVRVTAINSAGRGVPSKVSVIQLRPSDDFQMTYGWKGTAPGRPYATLLDSDRIVLEWAPAVADPNCAPITGYDINYRAHRNGDWLQSNDLPVTTCLLNLKPNGEYEFRVVARSADGPSKLSHSSGFIRLKPSVPSRIPQLNNANGGFSAPGQPQIDELDSNWVLLHWAEGGSADELPASYIVQYREIGDPFWYTAATAACSTSYKVECLRPNSTYEFRIISRAHDGSVSLPSSVSDVVQLRPSIKPGLLHGAPGKPHSPEYVDFDGGDRVTLCWFPATSLLPIQGYDVEFRDYQQDSAWYKVNESLIHSCKMTVGDLIPGHEYQFRLIACNAVGYSEPSDPSPPIHIGIPINGHEDYVEAAGYGSVPLLQDEIVRESPPLPDRDDSPPPIHRKFMRERDGCKEVIEYLDSNDKVEQLNASGYLQHLTFNDNAIKEETRELNGIPRLVRLLSSDVTDIQKNACGCLKNLSFGKENDENKRAINATGGINALTTLLCQTYDLQVMEEVTATLWNLSSCDDLKPTILNQVAELINQRIVVPGSGLITSGRDRENGLNVSHGPNMFRNATGILRNVSAASSNARKILRSCPRLVESFVHYLTRAVLRNQVDTRSVENVVCILRNLSYRIQEVEDENYDPKVDYDSKQRERSKSAPSGSPKSKKKEAKKKKNRNNHIDGTSHPLSGGELLWQPELIKLCLKLLQEASNPEILEASAGAIQNLAACEFYPSAQVRTCVRTEKGLPVLVELLRLNDDKVVCAVTTALRNLALDQRNRELIGKYAMKDLVAKLPRVDQRFRDTTISDATIGAVLGIMFEMVKHSGDFTRNIHECGGTERLRLLASSYPIYSARISKYASQVLYMMWQHKDLHDGFKRTGLKESDFYSGTTTRAREATTLSRPISSQGAERPSQFRTENIDESNSQYGTGRYDTIDSRVASEGSVYGQNYYNSGSSQNRPVGTASNQLMSNEALYASIHKREHDGSVGGDSWV